MSVKNIILKICRRISKSETCSSFTSQKWPKTSQYNFTTHSLIINQNISENFGTFQIEVKNESERTVGTDIFVDSLTIESFVQICVISRVRKYEIKIVKTKLLRFQHLYSRKGNTSTRTHCCRYYICQVIKLLSSQIKIERKAESSFIIICTQLY